MVKHHATINTINQEQILGSVPKLLPRKRSALPMAIIVCFGYDLLVYDKKNYQPTCHYWVTPICHLNAHNKKIGSKLSVKL